MKAAMSRTAVMMGLLLALPAPAEETASSAPAPSTPDQPRQHIDGAYPHPDFPATAEITDPTRISESFRQMLEQRMPSKSAPGGETLNAAPAAKLPEISLAANVCGHHKDMMHAMLRINGKIELVRPGEKLSIVDNNSIIEIQVLEIQRNHVHVRVLSAGLNEELILH